jgi:hypothetical protein
MKTQIAKSNAGKLLWNMPPAMRQNLELSEFFDPRVPGTLSVIGVGLRGNSQLPFGFGGGGGGGNSMQPGVTFMRFGFTSASTFRTAQAMPPNSIS